jgi:peptidoglycan/LPS O-acetylase OafA/YrhL
MEKLSKNTSIYLDLLRLAAAFCVFMTHSRNFIIPKLPVLLGKYGTEAVAVFFVLSGFVISYVVTEKERDWRSYCVARISRIYSVAIVAVIVTTILDYCGTYINNEQYVLLNDKFGFYRQENIVSFFRSITFTNELWFSHVIYGSNEPYWSLGFEVWYYILFGAFVFISPKYRLLGVLFVVLFCGIKIIMYFPLWCLGFFAYKSLKLVDMNRKVAGAIFTASIIALLSVIFFRKIFHPTEFYITFAISQQVNNFYYYHLIGVCVAINIITFDRLADGRHIFNTPQEKWIRWAAGASFTLYLIHQPMEVFTSALFPEIGNHSLQGVLALFLIIMSVLIFAELGERRKNYFKAIVEPMFFRRGKLQPVLGEIDNP